LKNSKNNRVLNYKTIVLNLNLSGNILHGTETVVTKEHERFIETYGFPIDVVNDASAREKQGGGRPPHWEMVFWWTRKPLAGARAVIAGALLPTNTDPVKFKYHLRLTETSPHRKTPVYPRSGKRCLVEPGS